MVIEIFGSKSLRTSSNLSFSSFQEKRAERWENRMKVGRRMEIKITFILLLISARNSRAGLYARRK